MTVPMIRATDLGRCTGLIIVAMLSFSAPAAGQGTPAGEGLRSAMRQADTVRVRALADSILQAAGAAPADRAEAAYWRAVASAPADSAHRALLAYVVDYPLTARTEDALARLGDDARDAGDRANAKHFYAQLVDENLASDIGARAAQSYAQMLSGEGRQAEACAVLDRAQQVVAAGSVELAAQVSYARRGCAAIADAKAARDSSPPKAPAKPAGDSATDTPEPKSGAKPPAKPAAKAVDTRQWSVQVGAFADRSDALRLAARLTSRKHDARVTTEAPFRVRVGRFTKRETAVALAKKFTAEKTNAIVVEAERP